MEKNKKELQRIMADPVLWAEKHLDEKPRWYQEQILRHPHNRIVLRMGRRLGKCIAGSQRILDTETGKYESIQSLYDKQESISLPSLDGAYKQIRKTSLLIEDNGVKETFNVQTKRGASVRLTGNHPVLTLKGWKEVDMLEVGESIAVPKELPYFGRETPSESRARAVGYLTGGYQHSTSGPLMKASVEESLQSVISLLSKEKITMAPKGKTSYFLFNEGSELTEVIKELPEVVPTEVFEYDKASLATFIASIYDVSGWLYAKRIPEIGLSSYSYEYIRTLRHLLLRFGIDANITKRQISGKTYYYLIMNTKRNIDLFISTIGVQGFRDYSELIEKTSSMGEVKDMLPIEIWPFVEKLQKEKGLKNYEVTGDKAEKFRKNVGINTEKALIYANNLESSELYDLALSDVYWEEVVEISSAGETQTFDVSVPETHNLVVEDIFVHNTWTMAIHMLWVAFTGMGGTVKDRGAVAVVATPYDNQAKLIFDELRRFIDKSEMLTNSIKSITKNPYYIEFKNGGKIKLFTAGTRSGGAGASLRGQAADFLYMDETSSPCSASYIEKLCEFREAVKVILSEAFYRRNVQRPSRKRVGGRVPTEAHSI